MVSLRAEREQAVALLRRGRWRVGAALAVVLFAIAGLLLLAGGKDLAGFVAVRGGKAVATRSADRGIRLRYCA